jgi:hypothetical protein
MVELIWLILGLVPYRIEKKYLPDGSWVFVIKAVVWSVSLHKQTGKRGKCEWSVHSPLLEQLQTLLRERASQPLDSQRPPS